MKPHEKKAWLQNRVTTVIFYYVTNLLHRGALDKEEKDMTVTTKSAIVSPVIKDEAVKVGDTVNYERTNRELVNNDSTSKSSINVLDTAAYDRINRELANNDSTGKWPVKAPYPLPGAVLPYNRIVAFYGNLYSKRMGILGELPKKEMLKN